MENDNSIRSNKINIYKCSGCGGQVVTVDAEQGVTPFTIRCRAAKDCDGTMESFFYNVPQDLKPEYQWRKPSKTEFYQLDEATRDHVLQGGLLIYPLKSDTLTELKSSRTAQKLRAFKRKTFKSAAIKAAKKAIGRRLTVSEMTIV